MTRVCSTCPTRLSRYNPDDICAACQAREAEAAVAAEAREEVERVERERAAETLRVARAAEDNARRERDRGLPRPGTLTRRVWDAMPGTLDQIAARTGLSSDQVRWTIPNMRRTGWVTAEGRAGSRGTGPLMVYRRATRDEEAA